MSEFAELLAEGISINHSLNSVYEIENVLILLAEIDKKVLYYKGLKKHRVQSIDEKISDLNAKTDTLRHIILNTMQKVTPDDKTLNFPTIGKVSRRKSKPSWFVDDEEAVLKFLEKQKMRNEVVEVSESVNKRKLNSLLDHFHKDKTVVPGTSLVKGQESLSITFDKNKDSADSTSTSTTSPVKQVDLDELDALLV